MISLPDVTLTLYETRTHKLGRLSLIDSQKRVQFGHVLVMTDKPLEFAGVADQIVEIPDYPTFEGIGLHTWYELPKYIETSHWMLVQYDSWVIDESQWTDEFLKYDYIGAPWWYTDKHNVGGGVFLRSKKLADTLVSLKEKMPYGAPEDNYLSRHLRPYLESNYGLRWAPEELAHRFAFERNPKGDNHFAFHGIYNWDKVLSPYHLRERLELALSYPHTRDKADFKELLRKLS